MIDVKATGQNHPNEPFLCVIVSCTLNQMFGCFDDQLIDEAFIIFVKPKLLKIQDIEPFSWHAWHEHLTRVFLY